MENQKYFKAEKIFARLSKIHKQKMTPIDIGTIIEWCAEIEIEVIGNWAQFERYDKYEITVGDGKALLPCNIYRILDVYDANEMRIMRYKNNGAYISFSDFGGSIPDGSKLYINYSGIPVDPETNYPLFLRGHEQALFHGCVVNLYQEDFSMGKMRGDAYQEMVGSYEIALNSCNNGFRHFSRNDAKDCLAVVCNVIQKINKTPFSL